MEAKKNIKYDTEKYRGVFFSIGLIVSMGLVIGAFEWNMTLTEEVLEAKAEYNHEDIIIPPTEQPEPTPPKPKAIVKEFIETVEEDPEIPDIEIVIDQEEVAEFVPDENMDINLEDEKAEEVFMIVEQMPAPKGGYEAFYEYMYANIEYPKAARTMGITGRVFVRFIIDEKGKITKPEIVKGIGAGCDEEALRVVSNSPNWIPGKQRGKEVKVQIVVPINFVLKSRTSF